MTEKIKRFFRLHKLTPRDLAMLLLTLLFLGLIIIFAVAKIMDSVERYNTRYYEPKDFQREEMIKKKVERR